MGLFLEYGSKLSSIVPNVLKIDTKLESALRKLSVIASMKRTTIDQTSPDFAPHPSPLSQSAFDPQGGQSMNAPPFQLKASPVIQRVVDLSASTQSENGSYIVPNNDQTTLYSRQGATDPVPASLYTRGQDVTNEAQPTALTSWTPNVRLFSNAEHGVANTRRTETVPSDAFCGLAGLLGYTQNVPQHNQEDGMIAGLHANVNGQPGSPTTGVIGKNDCGEFATHLQHLIGAGTDAPQNQPATSDRDTRVGDKMKHNLTDPDDCPYHYATIVAADGASKVTLEANAGADLQAPEFFIRDGIQGFMAANNAEYDNGEDFEITRLEKQSADEHQQSLNNNMLNANPDEPETYRTVGGRKITDTVSGV